MGRSSKQMNKASNHDARVARLWMDHIKSPLVPKTLLIDWQASSYFPSGTQRKRRVSFVPTRLA